MLFIKMEPRVLKITLTIDLPKAVGIFVLAYEAIGIYFDIRHSLKPELKYRFKPMLWRTINT